MKRIIASLWFIAYGLWPFVYAQDETLTLLTYYPAPYGVYQNLNVMGNIGIGTTNPQTKLHLLVPDDGGIRIQAGESGWGAARLEFYSDPIGNTNEWRPGYITSADSGSFTGRLDFYTNGTGSGQKTGSVLGMSIKNRNVGIGTTDPGAKLTVRGDYIIGIWGDTLLHIKRDIHPVPNGPVIATHDVLYASAGGNVGIGTTHPDSALDVNGDIECDLRSAGNTGYVGYVSSIANGGIYKFVRYSSSKKYKENIRDFHHGLDIIKQLRPVEFNWKSTGDKDFGFIAEEAEEVDPILVVRMNGEAETFKYMQLTAILTNAVKEQQNQIDILKQEINELKAKLNAGQ